MHTVLILGADAPRDGVAEAANGLSVRFADRLEDVENLDDVVAVVGHVPRGWLGRLPRLRWVHSRTAGVDQDLTDEIVTSDVELTSSAGNGAVPLAEHAMMLLLMLDRSALRWLEAQRERRWDRFVHRELAGSTLGIVGLGNVGRELARRAQAFDMRMIGVRRQVDEPVDGVERIVGPERLVEILPECDHVVVTVPGTSATARMFGDREFGAMKPTASWVCVSRGGVADDDALLRALRSGAIAGAGIDAHGVEPLPPGSPFWDLPNVVVTPHNGATTAATAIRGHAIVLENLARFARGDALVNVVDKTAGY